MRLLLLVGATSCRRRRNATWGRDPLNPCSGPLVAPFRFVPGPSSARPRLFSSLCCSLVSHPPRRSPPFHPLSVALSLSLSRSSGLDLSTAGRPTGPSGCLSFLHSTFSSPSSLANSCHSLSSSTLPQPHRYSSSSSSSEGTRPDDVTTTTNFASLVRRPGGFPRYPP